ncbi:MAG: tetratricopeptide repeat protein [Alphaproteobacteria bacterium]
MKMPSVPSWASLSNLTGDTKSTDLNRAANVVGLAERTRLEGDLKAAADLYAVAIDKMPKDAALHVRHSFVLLDLGRAREAEFGFRQALALQPNLPDAMRGLGNALLAQDRTTDAAAQFKLAMAATGSAKVDYRLYTGLGVALDLKGDHKAAQVAYRAGLKIHPDNLTLANNLGLSLALSGRHQEAIGILSKVVANDRATARHRQNLAMVHGLAGNHGQAAKIARSDVDANTATTNLAYYDVLRSMRGWAPAPAPQPAKNGADDPALDTVPLSLNSRGISANE